MSTCLSTIFNTSAKLYNISNSDETDTGQPIETLVFVKNLKVGFVNNIRKLYSLENPGNIKTGLFTIYSEQALQVNQVLEIAGVKYRITMADALGGVCQLSVHQSWAEHWQHT